MSSIIIALLLLFSWSLCIGGTARGKFYKPGLLSNTTCDPEVQRNAIPFRPRCFGAKFYYSLIGATIAKGQGCDALDIDPATTNFAVYVGVASDADTFWTGDFTKKAHKWTPDPNTSRTLGDEESDIGPNAAFFQFNKPRASGVGRSLFNVRYMRDRRPVPDRCGGLTLLIQIGDLQFMDPEGVYLELPSCEDPPKNAGIRSIQIFSPTGKIGIKEGCNPTIRVTLLASTPVVATRPPTLSGEIESDNYICLPSNRMFHNNTCTFRMAENMAEVFEEILSDEKRINTKTGGFRDADENGDELRMENYLPKLPPPVGPQDFRCQAAQYWYGVVSAQILCPEQCKIAGTASQCDQATLDALCGNKTCEPTVLVKRASQDGGIPVPWHLTASGSGKAYEYYRTYSQVYGDPDFGRQFVYQVIEQHLVNESECANLLIQIADRKEKLSPDSGLHPVADQPRYGRLTSNMVSTPLPLPFWSEAASNGMSRFFPFSKTYNTDLKCGLDNVRIKVNFILAYVNITDRAGSMACVTNRNYGCAKSDYRQNVWNWNGLEEARKLVETPQGIRSIRHGNHKVRTTDAIFRIWAEGKPIQMFEWECRVRPEVPLRGIS